MPFPARRPQTGFLLTTITDPATGYQQWGEQASIPLIRELLRRHVDLPDYGMSRFRGTRAQKTSLWREYRSYIIQALSYFDAAINIHDRSACLPLYYAMLNFAKAELLVADPPKIVGQRISHGLSFSPIKARKVASDALVVKNGIFRMFYEKRLGRQLPLNQRLPVQRLLRNIAEIGSQLQDVQFAPSALIPLFHMIAVDSNACWPVLLTWREIDRTGVTGKLFHRVFERVELNRATWRDEFGISKRIAASPIAYQSIDVAANPGPNTLNTRGANAITWRLKDILSLSLTGAADGFISPSLYESKLLAMPSPLARYAVIYYASSLVRYRPSIFDTLSAPENAYLFDAIAREFALPVLVDALTGLEGRAQVFYGDEFIRV